MPTRRVDFRYPMLVHASVRLSRRRFGCPDGCRHRRQELARWSIRCLTTPAGGQRYCRIYNRSQYKEERRNALQALASHLESLVQPTDSNANVIKIVDSQRFRYLLQRMVDDILGL